MDWQKPIDPEETAALQGLFLHLEQYRNQSLIKSMIYPL